MEEHLYGCCVSASIDPRTDSYHPGEISAWCWGQNNIRMLKKAVPQGRSERGPEAYPWGARCDE